MLIAFPEKFVLFWDPKVGFCFNALNSFFGYYRSQNFGCDSFNVSSAINRANELACKPREKGVWGKVLESFEGEERCLELDVKFGELPQLWFGIERARSVELDCLVDTDKLLVALKEGGVFVKFMNDDDSNLCAGRSEELYLYLKLEHATRKKNIHMNKALFNAIARMQMDADSQSKIVELHRFHNEHEELEYIERFEKTLIG